MVWVVIRLQTVHGPAMFEWAATCAEHIRLLMHPSRSRAGMYVIRLYRAMCKFGNSTLGTADRCSRAAALVLASYSHR